MTLRLAVLLVVSALWLPACQTSPEAPAVAAEEIRSGALLLAPLNLTIHPPAPLDTGTEAVWDALISYLAAQDRALETLEVDEARGVWLRVRSELEVSGSELTPDVAWSALARQLADQASYDLLVLPSLVLRRARVHGRQASWDGALRDLYVPFQLDFGARSLGGARYQGLRGKLAAASLHIAVLTAEGRLVYEGVGGLALVQEIDRAASAQNHAWRLQERARPFADAAKVRKGVELAFERGIPAAGLDW